MHAQFPEDPDVSQLRRKDPIPRSRGHERLRFSLGFPGTQAPVMGAAVAL
jgi:hypothetical protein